MDFVEQYRPGTFEQVAPTCPTGPLLTHLQRPDRSHGFLLKGPSGCGKTTVARLIAGAIGATIVEMNMADHNKIGDVRELITVMAQPTLFEVHTVYILDEPQRIQKDTQDLLLKVLEGGPDHATLILCTTEPGALITPLVNRCYVVPFTTLGHLDAKRFLVKIATCAGVSFTDPASTVYLPPETGKQIVEASEGIPRLLVRNLQQACDGMPLQVKETTLPSLGAFLAQLDHQNWPGVIRALKPAMAQYESEVIRQQAATFLRQRLESEQHPEKHTRYAAQLRCLSGLITDPDNRNVLVLKCFDACEVMV